MIRLTALYPAKDGETFNYDYYFNNHHKLLVSRLKPEGLVSCEFDKGVSDPGGGKAPYLAIAYLKFNSVEDLQKAVAINPSSPTKHFHLAQACLAVGDKERAKQSLETAKAKGLTPRSLHVLELPNYQSVFNALGSS